jgi:hypothetical protein
MKLRNQSLSRAYPIEIGALGDGEALEVTTQTVETELDGAEADPVATAIDARAARFRPLPRGDREMDAVTKIGPLGTRTFKTSRAQL